MNSPLNITYSCSFCDSQRMKIVIDFGEVSLAGGFLRPEQFATEKKFPLQVYFCEDCYAVQVVNKVQSDILFKNYFYFSSSINTLSEHFRHYAEEVTSRFLKSPSSSTVLEFGCNDGVLLRPLTDHGIRSVIGVDPATNIVDSIDDSRVTLINDYFTEAVAELVVNKYGKVDMIMANNVYAHIPDIQSTTRAVVSALAEDGVFIFEVHYLGKVITEMQYDMIYHEHLYYYSLLSAMKHFERYEMMVFDVKPIPVHAGSMRFYVCKKGSRHSFAVSENVRILEEEERIKGFDKYETFQNFSDQISLQRMQLVEILADLKKKGKRIAGYGASGRANTMIQYCGISHEHLDYMIDDAPAKAGYFTPGSHFQIFSNAKLFEESIPDYLLVFAWSFFEEIQMRNSNYLNRGGRMILPLPKVQVFPRAD